jgi:cell division protein FtsI/penicillin-binding protein 2
LEGLEKKYDTLLTRPSDDSGLKGFNLHLNIDGLIQLKIEKILEKYRLVSKAKRAVAIFIEVNSGKIIAMANTPGFDSNHYQRYKLKFRNNLAIRHNYEPGSTFKVFIAAALLSEKLINHKQKFICPGKIELKNSVIKCSSVHGKLTLEQIIKHSCNVGIIKAASMIPPHLLYKYLIAFGFNQKTGIDLVGETSGNIPNFKNWDYSSMYFYPIGQGLSITPIQLVRALAGIVAGGQLYKPYIASYFSNSFGEITKTFNPSPLRKVINSNISKILISYMQEVVKGGTGSLAGISGFDIAGKTGTGQISGKSGYIKGAYTSSFMGIYPGYNPQIAGLVLFDRPVAPYSGGGLAAPAFGEIIESIIPLIYSEKNIDFKELKKLKFEYSKLNLEKVPNFKGKSLKEVLFILQFLKTEFKISGSGYVVSQKPAAGSKLKKSDKIFIKLNVPKTF